MSDDPIVHIVDDDTSVRNATRRLLKSIGIEARTYPDARAFLDADRSDAPGCIVLDVRMPGLSGLDLQEELAKAGISLPIVFITAYGDIPMSVKAMKAGAEDFLPKPFDEQQLIDAVHRAIDRDRRQRAERAEIAELRDRIEALTPREREVFDGVVAGRLNKQIAADLGIAEKTVKFHRASMLGKMRVESVAELARIAERLGAIGPGDD
jgi:FixJ family two-component response regulator